MKKKISIVVLLVAVMLTTGCNSTVTGVHNDNNRLHVIGSEYIGAATHKPAGVVEVTDDNAISTTMGTTINVGEDPGDKLVETTGKEDKPVAPSSGYPGDSEQPVETTEEVSEPIEENEEVLQVPKEYGIFYADYGIKAVRKEEGWAIIEQRYYYTNDKLSKLEIQMFPLANYDINTVPDYTQGAYSASDVEKLDNGTYLIVNTDPVTIGAMAYINKESMYNMLKTGYELEMANN